jgi:hypothetical protein
MDLELGRLGHVHSCQPEHAYRLHELKNEDTYTLAVRLLFPIRSCGSSPRFRS